MSSLKIWTATIIVLLLTSSCSLSRQSSTRVWAQPKTDTIYLVARDYRVLSDDGFSMHIQFANKNIADLLTQKRATVIKLQMPTGQRVIVKPNPVDSSNAPPECDFFYAMWPWGAAFLNNNKDLVIYRSSYK